MRLSRSIRKFLRLRRRPRPQAVFNRVEDELRARTEAFAASTSAQSQFSSFGRLFRSVWTGVSERAFARRLIRWIRLLERDDRLRTGFQEAFQSMLAGLDSVSLFAEAGLPAHYAIVPEALRRIVQRLLPSARAESDTSRLLVSLFGARRDVERFLDLPDYLFERLRVLLWPSETGPADSPRPAPRMDGDLGQALCLLATRIAGRGLTPAMRERGSASHGETPVEGSPFYQLVFATERLVAAEKLPNGAVLAAARLAEWRACVQQCLAELGAVHLHMESSGVSADLVLDLRSIEMRLTRMSRLAELLDGGNSPLPASAPAANRSARPEGPATKRDAAVQDRPPAAQDRARAVRLLLNDLIEGLLEDRRLRSLLQQNLNLLARKTVEHTGHSGEHYIAHTNKEYRQMWLAALGGGLLTVLTAAIKMAIVGGNYPLFVEGFLSSANYAISFVLLNVFGLALSTKQPSATAATFAGIVRDNRGDARSTKIADFTAHITRTQLAAALGNILAVCGGAVVFEHLWRILFSESYLRAASAKHVYETLYPLTSGTIFYAAETGVLLWLAALIGGWCENFAVYNRITAAVAQHPFGIRVGDRSMQRIATWLELNISSWSTSIALGFLLGFTPVLAQFFGIPMEVRHVTLTTGTLALAVARFGTSSLGYRWFYDAAAGIAVTFVLNLGVSFCIAAFVALRAYDVRGKEQMKLLRFLLRQMARSPLKFIVPTERDRPEVSAGDMVKGE